MTVVCSYAYFTVRFRLLPSCGVALSRSGYWVYNLKKLPEGGYQALLVFTTDQFTEENGAGGPCDETGDPCAGVIAYPVKVSYQDGWVVTKTGDRQIYPISSVSQPCIQYGSSLLPYLAAYTATGESGTVTTRIQTICTVDNTIASSNSFHFFETTSFDETIKPNAKFASYSINTASEYLFGGDAQARELLSSVGMQVVQMQDSDSPPEFPAVSLQADSSGSSSDGSSWGCETVTSDWNGVVFSGGGSTWNSDIDNDSLDLPAGYAARIFWNGEVKETLAMKEVAADGPATTG